MRDWYGPDETREPWCFLTIASGETEESSMTGWALGFGNSERFLPTESQYIQTAQPEVDLIVSLAKILDTRRYTGMTLLTADERTLAYLRQRLVTCGGLQSPTLRGFNHIALVPLLERYFNSNSVPEFIEQNPRAGREEALSVHEETLFETVEQLWRTWTAIYQLVPSGACIGDPL